MPYTFLCQEDGKYAAQDASGGAGPHARLPKNIAAWRRVHGHSLRTSRSGFPSSNRLYKSIIKRTNVAP
jgi:hypothetical protein